MNNYCCYICEKGKSERDRLIDINNSAFDAVIDFNIFERECKKSCDKWRKYEDCKDFDHCERL